MANITQTAFANAVKTMYERRLLIRAVPRLVHGRFGVRAKISKFGSLEWRKYGALAAVTSALTEGTTPSEQAAPSITTVTATPLFYGSWVGYTDEIDMTSFDPYLSEVSGILGEQAGVSVDTLIRNALTDGATVDYSGGMASRATLDAPQHDITYADFVKQVAALEGENALPADGEDFICILHPHTWATLMQDPTFVAMFQKEAPSTPIRSGYVGRLLRCKLFLSANSREYADGGVGSTTDVYAMLFIGRESYGVTGIAGIDPQVVDNAGPDGKPLSGAGQRAAPVEIIAKPVGSAGADDPLNQRGSVGWKAALDTDVLNSAWVRNLEHTNAFSDD